MNKHEFLFAGIFTDQLLPVLAALLPLGLAWRAIRVSDPIGKAVAFTGMVAWTGFLMFLVYPELSNITPPALYLTVLTVGLVAMATIDLGRLDSLSQQLAFVVGMISLTVGLIGFWLPRQPPFPDKSVFMVLMFIGISGIGISKIFQTIARRSRDEES
jgi:hypothetical protein